MICWNYTADRTITPVAPEPRDGPIDRVDIRVRRYRRIRETADSTRYPRETGEECPGQRHHRERVGDGISGPSETPSVTATGADSTNSLASLSRQLNTDS